MRAALSWALEEGGRTGAAGGGSLWRFWDERDIYVEGRRWLEEALAKDGRASAVRGKGAGGGGLAGV